MVGTESRSILGNLRLGPRGISEVQQEEIQSYSDDMIFVVTVDAKFSMSQECILTGNKAQPFLILYITEYYEILCGGKVSLIIKFSNTFHLLPPNMQQSPWFYCSIILY